MTSATGRSLLELIDGADEEGGEEPGRLLRPFERGEVTGPVEVDAAGAGQQPGEVVGDRPEVGEVVGADGDEGGDLDPGEVVGGDLGAHGRKLLGRGELELEGAPLHLPDEGAGLRSGLGAEPGVDVELDGAVQVPRFEQFVLPAAPGAQRVARHEAGHRGAEQGERGDVPRVAGGELQGDLAAEGGADDDGRCGAEVVEQVADVVGMGVRGVDGGVAEAAEVAADDPVAGLREGVELTVPHPAVADPRVEQENGRGAVAGQVMSERHPATLGGGTGAGQQVSTSA